MSNLRGSADRRCGSGRLSASSACRAAFLHGPFFCVGKSCITQGPMCHLSTGSYKNPKSTSGTLQVVARSYQCSPEG